ncbi:MAG: hypothetical protein J0M19_05980 [Sphingomonadales bacterium]|nr:hypothetical protein [Sphingomonadales bacterium]
MRPLSLLGGAVLLGCAVVPAAARAGTCEDTFQKKGNPITGLRFTAQTAVADLPPDIAILQLQSLAAQRGYIVIAAEPQNGELLLEQASTGKARGFPITANATVAPGGVGTIQIVAKLPAGMGTKADLVKAELCGLLAQVKGGKEGRLAAKKGGTGTASNVAPVATSAQEFSQQISKDAERNALTIPQRYKGRKFTLSGQVEYVVKDGDKYRVAYKILQPHELALRLPNMAANLAEVSCLLAPGNSVFALQLKPGKSVKLTGTFYEYSEIKDVVWFMDCVPVKS